jgi:Uma2 family endonuclease
MNIQSSLPTTPDEFLRWNEGREGKREFVHGRVVEMMINVTRDHWRLANRLERQLATQLGDEEYDTGTTDHGVRTADGIRFPDVMVDKVIADGKALAATSPLLLAEVLSKSSVDDDFGPKARDYQNLPSLQHYLVVSQDEARVWVWSRSGDGGWLEPAIHETGSIRLIIDGKDVLVDLAALYLGIATSRRTS